MALCPLVALNGLAGPSAISAFGGIADILPAGGDVRF